MTREEFIEKWGASMGHGFTDEELSADLDELLSLPPAEGAGEIQPTAYEWHNYKTGHSYVDYIPHLDAKEGYVKTPLYTALHAQRIADKMVSERMKKVESLLNMAAGLVGNPCTNISSSCDIACDDWQGEYNEYLKSRYSHD